MNLKVACPGCGKSARYPAAEIGLPAVCAACGARFTIAAATSPAQTPAADVAAANVAASAGPARGSMRPWAWMAMAAGLLLGLGVGVVVAVTLIRSHQAKSAAHSTPLAIAPSPSPKSPPAVVSRPSTAPVTPVATVIRTGAPPRASIPLSSTPESVHPGAIAMNVRPVNATLIPGRSPSIPALPPVVGPASVKPTTSPTTKPTNPIATTRPAAPAAAGADTLTDARIGQAITDGVNFLISRVDNTKHELRESRLEMDAFGGGNAEQGALFGGRDALCVYALLQSGQAIHDPRLGIKYPYMISLIEQMKKMPDQSGPVTYARALRCTALALYNRPEDAAAIKLDLDWLLKAAKDGAYTYDLPDRYVSTAEPTPGRRLNRWDNSNSQYGLLGVWSAAEAGFAVPAPYWKEVEDHWTTNQLPNGEWAYHRPDAGEARLSMTVAGVASLFVTHDWLVAPKFGNDVGRDPFSPPLLKGLNWLENGNNAVDMSSSREVDYTYYGIERAGLASGFKYFGSHDWYREIARRLLADQNANGSWGPQALVDTSYALLFLARGRHPILMNKLRFDGFWANRPRDMANLSKYVSTEMEQPVNWQVVPISHDWIDWTDCPILYMASHKAPVLTDRDYDNIRSFIQSGGMLYTQADGGELAFTHFVEQMSSKLFPAYEMADLPLNHPLYSVLFHESAKPRLRVVSNGARLLIVHSPNDLARAWQLRQDKLQKTPFEFGLNLFLYASGKHDLRNRLETNIIPAPSGTPKLRMTVARLRYAGNWDPEPYAWTRFTRWFQTQTGYGLNVQNVEMSELTPQTAPVAILTGTAAYNPKPAELDAIKKYVIDGGVLFVDVAGGTGAFEESARTKLFALAFPMNPLAALPSEHPLLNAGPLGRIDLTHARLRAFTLEKLGSSRDEFPNFFSAGRGHVIFSSMDMTCGLLGTYTWGILGYEPDYSQNFIKNLLLWTADGQKDESP